MKFAIILNAADQVLGREYEKPYSYSSWTSGGDYWMTTWGDLHDKDEDGDIFRPLIFESKKDAETYVKGCFRTKEIESRVILIKDI